MTSSYRTGLWRPFGERGSCGGGGGGGAGKASTRGQSVLAALPSVRATDPTITQDAASTCDPQMTREGRSA